MSGLEDVVRTDLLALAEAYALHTGHAVTTISKNFYGRHNFLAKFEKKGCSITVRQVDQMIAKFSSAWPHDLPWPKTRLLRRQRRGKVDRSPQVSARGG